MMTEDDDPAERLYGPFKSAFADYRALVARGRNPTDADLRAAFAAMEQAYPAAKEATSMACHASAALNLDLLMAGIRRWFAVHDGRPGPDIPGVPVCLN